MTNNDLQKTTQKTKEWLTQKTDEHKPHKKMHANSGALEARVSNSNPTSSTCERFEDIPKG
jgi:hypothetical protein